MPYISPTTIEMAAQLFLNMIAANKADSLAVKLSVGQDYYPIRCWYSPYNFGPTTIIGIYLGGINVNITTASNG